MTKVIEKTKNIGMRTTENKVMSNSMVAGFANSINKSQTTHWYTKMDRIRFLIKISLNKRKKYQNCVDSALQLW